MCNFFDEKFEEINKIKYLMTFCKEENQKNIYRENLEKVFKEFILEKDEVNKETFPIITREELASFNGKDKEKIYIAIEGVIYDISNLKEFKESPYNSLKAGSDVTEEYNNLLKDGNYDILKNINKVALLAEPYEEEVIKDKEDNFNKEELNIIPLEELSKNNGEKGSLYYIAIEGIVYDISNLPLVNILKNMGLSLGKDLTEEFKNKYRGDKKILEGAKKIGILHEFKESIRGKHIEN